MRFSAATISLDKASFTPVDEGHNPAPTAPSSSTTQENSGPGLLQSAFNAGRSALYSKMAGTPQQALASPAAMKNYLAWGGAINKLDEKGKNLFHLAAQGGDPEMLGVMLEHMGTMTESERNGILNARSKTEAYAMTPLGLAAWCGKTEAVALLAKTPGVDLNAKNTAGMTPAMCAEHFSNVGALEVLLNTKGVDVNATDNHGRTVLSRAAIDGRHDNIGVILKQKDIDLDLGKTDEDGKNALDHAAGKNQFEAAKLLINDPRVDSKILNARDNLEATPFFTSMVAIAGGSGDVRIANLFLHKDGVDLNAADKTGTTPLGLYLVKPEMFEGLDTNAIQVDGNGVISKKTD